MEETDPVFSGFVCSKYNNKNTTYSIKARKQSVEC